MKYKNLFWAILLIAIGLLFMLGNFGLIHFNWYSFWRLWPLILVFWGIAILPIKDLFKFVLLIAAIAIAIIFFNRIDESRPWYFRFHNDFDKNEFRFWDSEKDNDITYNYRDQNLTVPFDSLAKKGILNLDAAAGNFTISDTTTDFLAFNKTGDVGNYELTSSDLNGVKSISLKMSEGRVRHNIKKNSVKIKLNPQPAWNLELNIGAAELDLDLRGYKIDTALFSAGASSIDIRIGDKNPVTVIDFDAGASSITVKVPKASGCQVSSKSFMVSREFEGLEKTGENVYQSPGFANSTNKVFINVQTAISKIRIERY
jgi:hypothetical protein